MRTPLALVAFLLALLPAAVHAAPWYSPATLAGGAAINASVQNGTQIVIVGGAGLIATSTNGRDWTRRTSGTTVKLFSVTYGSGRFVAVGEKGTIVSSADGVTWTTEKHPYSPPLAPDINGITHANNRFVAVSRSLGFDTTGNIITSTDGRTWTRQTVDRAGFQLQFVAFGNGQFVAGGGGVLMVSSDATTWRTVWTGNTTWLYSGVRGSSRWAVFGNDGTVLTSADGTTWTESGLGQRATAYSAVFRNGRFLAVGSNAFTIPGNTASVFSSADGLAWTALPFSDTSPMTRWDSLNSLLPTATGFLAFGNGGLIAETTDGAAWNVLSQPVERPHFFDVVYANGLFVAVGSKATNLPAPGINEGRLGAIYTSTDGWNWQEQASGIRGSILNKIAFGGGRFVAVGTGGVVVYSTDGVSWQRATSPISASLQGVAYGAGRFVAVGPGTMTSTDGSTWQIQPGTAGNNYAKISFANGSFFLSVSPFSGPVQRSTDGVNWTTISPASPCAFNDVAFADGLWVAATSSSNNVFEGANLVSTGGLQYSTDGNQWTAVRTPYLGTPQSVLHLKDRWVASTSEGAIFSSTNGRDWSLEEIPTSNGIARIAANADYAVAVGDYATTLATRDPKTLPATIRPSISTAPVAQTVVAGQTLRLTVNASGTPAPTYQWMKDGVAMSGAIGATYTVAASAESDAGVYTVVATNSAGSVTSAPVTITILASRIANLSILSSVSAASPELTVGFFASGTGKPLLVRAIGPALAQFNVASPLSRPGLSLYTNQTPLGTNEGWDRAVNAAQVAVISPQIGAFDLPAGSSDAAALQTFANGSYSAVVRGVGGATAGAVLVEIYDAAPGVGGRLTNVSTLASVGTGANILTAGFVLSGNTTKRLLIRAIGPGLTGFGRTAALVDPQFSVIRSGSQTILAANDNWGGSESLAASFQSVGAFPLAGGSKDAAAVLTLDPGAYTVQVSGVGGATGEALVEIYELP